MSFYHESQVFRVKQLWFKIPKSPLGFSFFARWDLIFARRDFSISHAPGFFFDSFVWFRVFFVPFIQELYFLQSILRKLNWIICVCRFLVIHIHICQVSQVKSCESNYWGKKYRIFFYFNNFFLTPSFKGLYL